MSVAARFWVQSIKRTAVSGGDVSREVTLAPVIRSDGGKTDSDNVSWSKYTPSGEIRLVVTADAAGQWFEDHLAKDVAISFSDPE